MPGLMALRAKYGPSKPSPAPGYRGSLHMTLQTAVLIETLVDLGADLRWSSCNIFSTQDQAAAAVVVGRGAGSSSPCGSPPSFAWKAETLDEYWELLDLALAFPGKAGEPCRGPDLIVDDGGDATVMFHLGFQAEKDPNILDRPCANEDEAALYKRLKAIRAADPTRWSRAARDLKGVSEETTTGVHRLYRMEKEGKLLIPAINVNDLRHEEQIRQSLRLPRIPPRRHQARHRRHDRRQGGRGLRLRRRRKGLRPEPPRHGSPSGRLRDRPHLRPAGGDGRLYGGRPRGTT